MPNPYGSSPNLYLIARFVPPQSRHAGLAGYESGGTMTAKFDEATFKSLFPGGKDAKSGHAIEFKSEDAEYRIYIPGKGKDKSTLTTHADGSLDVFLYEDHVRHQGHDDTSRSTLKFDAQAKLTSTPKDLEIQISQGTKYHINTDAVDVITDSIALIGLILGPETEGLSVAIAEEIAEDIKILVKVFNGICTILNHFGDDGGRLNFPAVVVHTMNKTCASVGA
jgi:hypothetical protein